jgi:hypothetical protein
MKSSRAVLVALTLAGALAFTAGCVSGGVSDSTHGTLVDAPTVAADPTLVLTASITKAKGTSGKFTIHSEAGSVTTDASGAADSTTRQESATVTIAGPGKTVHEQTLVVGTDIYVKSDVAVPGMDPNKWIHLDTTRLKSLASLGLGDPSDPTNVTVYGQELATVQQTSPGHFVGTLDITKAPLGSITSAILAQAGDALKSVPFEATVDSQDRFTSITVKMPALGNLVPASTTTVTFSDFGTSVSVQAPAASETQEAPDALYQAFGG